MDEIEAREVIADHLGLATASVVDDVSLAELGADPLDVVALVLRLERTFGVRISDEQAESFRTVADVLGVLRASLGPSPETAMAGASASARR